MARNADENRANSRMDLISSMRDYKKACEEAGYPFADDLIDVVHEATEGSVQISVEDHNG